MDADRSRLAQRGTRLEYITIGWNSLEGLIAVGAGAVAGSISLTGFGVDSFIEVTSAAALLWRVSGDADARTREHRERLTLRIVGICFLLLAAYVTSSGVTDLLTRSIPHSSIVGIALACASLVVMPVLSRAKRRLGRSLGSSAMRADATQSRFCAYLSAILLAGLLLNAVWHWWWADPVAALIMVPIIAREGVHGLRGESCCD
jgi:divalent metal cation (Fe/Co/Zn/Cd) transporter